MSKKAFDKIADGLADAIAIARVRPIRRPIASMRLMST
jgi:hypothetical protein